MEDSFSDDDFEYASRPATPSQGLSGKRQPAVLHITSSAVRREMKPSVKRDAATIDPKDPQGLDNAKAALEATLERLGQYRRVPAEVDIVPAVSQNDPGKDLMALSRAPTVKRPSLAKTVADDSSRRGSDSSESANDDAQSTLLKLYKEKDILQKTLLQTQQEKKAAMEQKNIEFCRVTQDLQTQLDTMHRANIKLKLELKELRDAKNNPNMDEDVEMRIHILKDQVDAMSQENKLLRQELDQPKVDPEMQSRLEELEEQNARLKQENDTLLKETENDQLIIETVKQERDQMRIERDNFSQQKENYFRDLSKSEIELNQTNLNMKRLERSHALLQQRCESLKKLVADMEANPPKATVYTSDKMFQTDIPWEDHLSAAAQSFLRGKKKAHLGIQTNSVNEKESLTQTDIVAEMKPETNHNCCQTDQEQGVYTEHKNSSLVDLLERERAEFESFREAQHEFVELEVEKALMRAKEKHDIELERKIKEASSSMRDTLDNLTVEHEALQRQLEATERELEETKEKLEQQIKARESKDSEHQRRIRDMQKRLIDATSALNEKEKMYREASRERDGYRINYEKLQSQLGSGQTPVEPLNHVARSGTPLSDEAETEIISVLKDKLLTLEKERDDFMQRNQEFANKEAQTSQRISELEEELVELRNKVLSNPSLNKSKSELVEEINIRPNVESLQMLLRQREEEIFHLRRQRAQMRQQRRMYMSMSINSPSVREEMSDNEDEELSDFENHDDEVIDRNYLEFPEEADLARLRLPRNQEEAETFYKKHQFIVSAYKSRISELQADLAAIESEKSCLDHEVNQLRDVVETDRRNAQESIAEWETWARETVASLEEELAAKEHDFDNLRELFHNEKIGWDALLQERDEKLRTYLSARQHLATDLLKSNQKQTSILESELDNLKSEFDILGIVQFPETVAGEKHQMPHLFFNRRHSIIKPTPEQARRRNSDGEMKAERTKEEKQKRRRTWSFWW